MEQSAWIRSSAIVVALLVSVAAYRSWAPTETPPITMPPAIRPIRISIASSITKQAWLHRAVNAFNESSKRTPLWQLDGRPIAVQILQETVEGKSVDYRSGTMIADTLNGTIKPTILSPGEESWLARFIDDWKLQHTGAATHGDSPVLVRTPLVLAMWQSRARALGCFPSPRPTCTWERLRALAVNPKGWASLGHPGWEQFTLGYGYFGESNSGTLGVLAMCMVGAKKSKGLALPDIGATTGCGRFVGEMEQAKFHSGKSDQWLLERMVLGGPDYLDAVVSYESSVIAINRAHPELREPLVAVYPQDGTFVVGHPFAILDGTPWVTNEQALAAKVLLQFMLSPEQQRAVLAEGLRPVDATVTLGSPVDATFGANPEAKLTLLEVPSAATIAQLGEVWHRVKKHAVLVMLFDKSGSMSERGKLAAAIKGAQGFVRRMDNEDQLLWMPFDSKVQRGTVRGAKAEVGEQLSQSMGETRASGGTALYDAIAAAFDELEGLRALNSSDVRYGVVLLSDGQDTNSHSTLAELEHRLQPREGDARGIQIHTIAIGDDADVRVLTRIAAAAHGRFWKGETEKDLDRIYQDIATYW